jgi:hypothetical protein
MSRRCRRPGWTTNRSADGECWSSTRPVARELRAPPRKRVRREGRPIAGRLLRFVLRRSDCRLRADASIHAGATLSSPSPARRCKRACAEVGTDTGLNFGHRPSTVSEVVTIEPERRLRAAGQRAAQTVSARAGPPTGRFGPTGGVDAAIAGLMLCSVPAGPAHPPSCTECCSPAATSASTRLRREPGPPPTAPNAVRRGGAPQGKRGL